MKTLYIDGTAPLKPQGLQDLSKLIQKSTRIIVLTGAGISTSSGIPDFKGNPAARDLLDAVNLGRGRNDGWIKTLQWCSNTRQQATQAKPSKTHRYIGALAEQQKLLRYYTQNVDGIESREKILPPELIVLLHGSLESLRCLKCCSESAWSHTFDDNIWKKEPQPTFCITGCVTTNVKRGGALGVLSPNILLYNEDNPREKEITDQINADTIWRADLPDLFIVIGTSLRIRDTCKATKAFSDAVHKAGGKVIFVNKTAPSTQWKAVFEYFVKGDCDSWAEIMTDSRCLEPTTHTEITPLSFSAGSPQDPRQTQISNSEGSDIYDFPPFDGLLAEKSEFVKNSNYKNEIKTRNARAYAKTKQPLLSKDQKEHMHGARDTKVLIASIQKRSQDCSNASTDFCTVSLSSWDGDTEVASDLPISESPPRSTTPTSPVNSGRGKTKRSSYSETTMQKSKRPRTTLRQGSLRNPIKILDSDDSDCLKPWLPRHVPQDALARVMKNDWIEDTALNAAIGWICYAFSESVHIDSTLTQEYERNNARHLPKSLLDARSTPEVQFMIPNNVENKHWVLTVVKSGNTSNTTIYDSLQQLGMLPGVTERMERFVTGFLGYETATSHGQCPQQSNKDDCGVYVIATAYHESSGVSQPKFYDSSIWRSLICRVCSDTRPPLLDAEFKHPPFKLSFQPPQATILKSISQLETTIETIRDHLQHLYNQAREEVVRRAKEKLLALQDAESVFSRICARIEKIKDNLEKDVAKVETEIEAGRKVLSLVDAFPLPHDDQAAAEAYSKTAERRLKTLEEKKRRKRREFDVFKRRVTGAHIAIREAIVEVEACIETPINSMGL